MSDLPKDEQTSESICEQLEVDLSVINPPSTKEDETPTFITPTAETPTFITPTAETLKVETPTAEPSKGKENESVDKNKQKILDEVKKTIEPPTAETPTGLDRDRFDNIIDANGDFVEDFWLRLRRQIILAERRGDNVFDNIGTILNVLLGGNEKTLAQMNRDEEAMKKRVRDKMIKRYNSIKTKLSDSEIKVLNSITELQNYNKQIDRAIDVVRSSNKGNLSFKEAFSQLSKSEQKEFSNKQRKLAEKVYSASNKHIMLVSKYCKKSNLNNISTDSDNEELNKSINQLMEIIRESQNVSNSAASAIKNGELLTPFKILTDGKNSSEASSLIIYRQKTIQEKNAEVFEPENGVEPTVETPTVPAVPGNTTNLSR
jgi:hypothetical protein